MPEPEEQTVVEDQTMEDVEDQELDTKDVSPEGDEETPPDDTDGTIEDTDKEPSDEADEGLDEGEFIKQYGFPGDVTTTEELAEYAKNLKDGLLVDTKKGQTQAEKDLATVDNILRQRGYANGVQDVLGGGGSPVSPQAGQETVPKMTYVSDTLQEQVNRGELSAEDAQFHTPMARNLDIALRQRDNITAAMFEHFNNILNPLQGNLKSLTNTQRDNAYSTYVQANKGKYLPKTELDKVLKDIPQFNHDYTKAHAFLMVNDNEKFSNLLSNIEKGAMKKLNRSKKRRFLRGGGVAKTQAVDYSKYLLPDGTINRDMLDKVDDKTADKVLEYYTKTG